MDILAHSLWSAAALKTIPQTRNKKQIIGWGVLFGILPDLISFAPVFVYYFFQTLSGKSELIFGPPTHLSDSGWFVYALNSYNFTHSLVIWGVVVGLIYLFARRVPWVLLPWGLHIVIDIFSHTEAFFPTPFLFPVSNFHISIFSWGHPVFMIVNYGLLLIFYLKILPNLKKNTQEPSNGL